MGTLIWHVKYLDDPISVSARNETKCIVNQSNHEAILIPQAILQLSLRYSRRDSWDIASGCYEHLLDVKPIYVALLECVKFPHLPPDFLTKYGHQDDWDVNTALFNSNCYWPCSAQLEFKNNEKFLLEAMRILWRRVGCFDLFFEASFLSEVLAHTPGALDYVANCLFNFHANSEYYRRSTWGIISLEKLPDVFRAHKRYVIGAVAERGSQLQYASKKLRDDEHVVAAAVLPEPQGFQYASERLRERASALDNSKMALLFFAYLGYESLRILAKARFLYFPQAQVTSRAFAGRE